MTVPHERSRSAMSAAVARGTHRLWDEPPWIVDDPYALLLVGPGWREIAAASRGLARPEVTRQGHAGVLVRSRYAEDCLLDGDYVQYVMLGAGLDSFAWRRPDLCRALDVFEVDDPATQAWKRTRAESLALPLLGNHRFVPIDFETQSLDEALDTAGFDRTRRALFSWVGTTMYLGAEAVAATLGVVGSCAPGSAVVLSYNQDLQFVDDIGREFLAAIMPHVAESGEPVRTSFSPSAMEALLEHHGLTVIDHPTADDLFTRYCSDRCDRLRPYTLERLVLAANKRGERAGMTGGRQESHLPPAAHTRR
jgi:methyltransferase (TIGR00027 family)